MPDEIVDNQAAAEAPATEQAATEVAAGSSEGQAAAQTSEQQAQQAASWQFGGNVYNDPHKLYEAARKWESEITRKNQERASKDKETATRMGQMEAIINAIRGDDTLRQLVIQKIQAGQTPKQAMENTVAQLPPEVLNRLETLEGREREREQGTAIDEFAKSHKDLGNSEWSGMADWLDANKEWAGNLPPQRQLALAYAEVVVPKLSAKYLQMGQQQKEEEIKKGEKSAFLGSQAPTAGAKPAKAPERPRHATPAQEREHAMKVFRHYGNQK